MEVNPGDIFLLQGKEIEVITTAFYKETEFVVCHIKDAPRNALITKEAFIALFDKENKM